MSTGTDQQDPQERDSSHPVTLIATSHPQHHTHLQQVAGCLQVDVGGGPGC
jgi:hypothetical protein